MPILAPIPPHRQPPRPRPLDLHGGEVPCAGDVANQHGEEYPGAADGEPDAALLPAAYAAVLDGHVGGLPDGDLLEGLDGEDEVGVRGVALAAAVGVEGEVGGAEVGGGDDDGGAGDAPAEVLDAAEFEAGAADLAALEEDGAEGGGGLAVAGLHEVAVAAGAADGVDGVHGGVVSGAGGLPVGMRGGGGGGGEVVGADRRQ